jgi:hypothetical protein
MQFDPTGNKDSFVFCGNSPQVKGNIFGNGIIKDSDLLNPPNLSSDSDNPLTNPNAEDRNRDQPPKPSFSDFYKNL